MLGLAVLVGATVLASCGSGPGPYTVTAVFPSAEGLFPGNAVQVLGVASGTVTKVTPTLHDVVVTMSVNGAAGPSRRGAGRADHTAAAR